MKKYLKPSVIFFTIIVISAVIVGLMSSFTPNQVEKKLKLEFTETQANVIYKALGKLPAEESEGIRSYITFEYQKQFIDTTKSKK